MLLTLAGVAVDTDDSHLFKLDEGVAQRVSGLPVSDDLTAVHDKVTTQQQLNNTEQRANNCAEPFGGQHHLLMDPKREKMISRSSSVVTGFSLHTNSTFSGGRTSASGRSPTWRAREEKGLRRRRL